MNPTPDPEMGNRLQSAAEDLAAKVYQEKGQWSRRVMEAHLPPEIFALAQSPARADQMRLKDHMDTNEIKLWDHPEHSELRRGQEVLGTFRVRFKDGQCSIAAIVTPPKEAE